MIRAYFPIFIVFLSAGLYSQTDCDTTLWSHVYHPERLIVQDPACITVTGVVDVIYTEPDGNYHIRLKADSEYVKYLVSGNFERQYGCLVLEIICACKMTQEDAIESCGGYENQITIPKKGDYISVTGSYVWDRNSSNSWSEIHSVSKLEVLK